MEQLLVTTIVLSEGLALIGLFIYDLFNGFKIKRK